MAINLNDNLSILAPKPVDARYGPYESLPQALLSIPVSFRHIGLTVGVETESGVEDYWFQTGVQDPDLVEKGSGVGEELWIQNEDGIHTLEKVGINISTPLEERLNLDGNLSLSGVSVHGSERTLAAGSEPLLPEVIHQSFSTSYIRSIEYTIQVEAFGSRFQVSKVMCLHDDTNIYYNQYGNLYNQEELAEFEVYQEDSTIKLRATPLVEGLSRYAVRYEAIRNLPLPFILLGAAKLLMIGSPYRSLNVSDPTAVFDSFEFSTPVLGCQTVSYVPGLGIIAHQGGRISRTEQSGDTTTPGYIELALYDLDGNFVRRLNYQDDIFGGTYYYSFESPRFHHRLADGRIFAHLSDNEWVVCDSDLTNPTRLAFNIPIFLQSVSANPSSGKVLFNSFQSSQIWAHSLNSNLTPSWTYSFVNNSAGYTSFLRAYDCLSAQIAESELNLFGGTARRTIDNRLLSLLLTIDSTGTFVNAWSYENVSDYVSLFGSYKEDVFYYLRKGVDGSIIASGVTPHEPYEFLNNQDPEFPFTSTVEELTGCVAKINPVTGDVINAVSIRFSDTIEWYGIEYFSHPTHEVDTDGTVYLTFGGYFGGEMAPSFNAVATFLIKLSPGLEVLGALCLLCDNPNEAPYNEFNVCGITLSEDKVILPGHWNRRRPDGWGNWDDDQIAEGNVKDALVAIVDKNSITSNSGAVGEYWKVDIPGGPADIKIENFTAYCEALPITLSKQALTATRSTIFMSTKPPEGWTATAKQPTSVVLTKV